MCCQSWNIILEGEISIWKAGFWDWRYYKKVLPISRQIFNIFKLKIFLTHFSSYVVSFGKKRYSNLGMDPHPFPVALTDHRLLWFGFGDGEGPWLGSKDGMLSGIPPVNLIELPPRLLWSVFKLQMAQKKIKDEQYMFFKKSSRLMCRTQSFHQT